MNTEKFAPTVKMPGGGIVTPPGWVWVLAFALAGQEWAIEITKTKEFKEQYNGEVLHRL